ncbi:MAG: tRNA-binding protein [Rhizobiales bacterium]|nr:tRNA-binding protein [Hyphomicrobiales bacterium]NRB14057.1 tRNA-binding protein [Hyphomicrobiales bacterium]
MTDEISFDDFLKVDIRSGKIIKAEPFPEARKPAYKLHIDFGAEIGIKKSSAQITENYTLEELIGKNIMAVVNFPPRQIGPVRSEVLVLGFYDHNNHVELVSHSDNVKTGQRLN